MQTDGSEAFRGKGYSRSNIIIFEKNCGFLASFDLEKSRSVYPGSGSAGLYPCWCHSIKFQVVFGINILIGCLPHYGLIPNTRTRQAVDKKTGPHKLACAVPR